VEAAEHLPGPSGSEPESTATRSSPASAQSDRTPPPRSGVPILDLAREYEEVGELLATATREVFSRQNFILGAQTVEFERVAALRCGVSHAVGCASGTDALWLALTACRIGAGDAVVTTPFSFFASVSSILRAGARPILADIEPETFNLDPEAVRRGLNSAGKGGARAILAVDLYGQTADWDRLHAIRQEYSAGGPAGSSMVLIEDAAQAFGARWDGRPAGSLADVSAFSFYPTKNLGAAGDAGMVTTSSEEVAERLRMLRTHGMRKRYYHDELGACSRMDTLQAAVLLAKLRFLDEWNRRRRVLASNYGSLLERAGIAERGPYPERGVVPPKVHPKAEHIFHQYVIRVRRRDELKEFLKSQEVSSEIYYPLPLHLQQALSGLGYGRGAFPESERAAREVLALPMFPQLTPAEQETVVAAVQRFLG
jgi:dTDP-4-amino-4,6-dideoxygalactose transaminase